MAHISKQQLSVDHLNQLSDQFASTLGNCDQKAATNFISEILGAEESIMIAKRFAAIVMFIEGNSSYRVWQLLKLSPSTADRIRLNYESGSYQNIERILKGNKTQYIQIWKTLEIILSAGLPPRGRGRWKSILQSK